jgi:DNA-binding MarR family transcriptional regulator
MSADALELARKILDVIPQSMARIRTEMRAASPADLSVPQYRILGSIYRGRNLAGAIAKHQGVSQPAMSKMIEALVEKSLIRRDTQSKDRRQVPLLLTDEGEALFLKIRRSAQQEIGRRTVKLNARDRKELLQGLRLLESFFQGYGAPDDEKKGPARKLSVS